MKVNNQIMLSFDVEEFDTPLEYGKDLALDEQFEISLIGLKAVLSLLNKYGVIATFFTTANFAQCYPDLVKAMSKCHEIASHGFYHSCFEVEDLINSRLVLENLIEKPVYGYRMARMMPVANKEIYKAGYLYNASLHPTFIPGRYNNFNKPRSYFVKNNVLQIPASVTPIIRFPLFWLSFKNLPMSLIKLASKRVMQKDNYVNLYFHPWEFTDTTNRQKFGLPFYISDNGNKMLHKLEQYIQWCNIKAFTFCTYYDLFKQVS